MYFKVPECTNFHFVINFKNFPISVRRYEDPLNKYVFLSLCLCRWSDLSGVDVLTAGVERRRGAGAGWLGRSQAQQ